jgi:hypothetical protein
MFEVFKSVSSSNTCGGIAPHLGKSAPFRVGQSSNPYLPHYRTAFASSRIFYLHGISPSLAVGILLGLTPCTARRAIQAYRVPPIPQDGVRTPLYTGWCCECAGPPSKLACLTTLPFWLWSRMVALAPLLSRYVTTRLYLHYPYPSFPTAEPACYSPSYALPNAQHPTVAGDAPPVREQVTLHHGCISSPSDYSSGIGDSTSQ